MLLATASFGAAPLWAIMQRLVQARVQESVGSFGDAAPPSGGWPAVVVAVPARDEADVIGRRVAELLAQDDPHERLRVLVVDDGSTDVTAKIAHAAASGEMRLRVVPRGRLSSDWTGKDHAYASGADGVSEDAWICSMDADTRAEPGLLRTAAPEAIRRRGGLLSLEPVQELGGLAERLVVTCGCCLIPATGDYAAVSAPGSDAAAVRAEGCEDVALVGCAKRDGSSFALLGAEL